MQLNITLDHSDTLRSVFTMTIVGDPDNAAAGTYTVDKNTTITLTVPESEATITSDEQE